MRDTRYIEVFFHPDFSLTHEETEAQNSQEIYPYPLLS